MTIVDLNAVRARRSGGPPSSRPPREAAFTLTVWTKPGSETVESIAFEGPTIATVLNDKADGLLMRQLLDAIELASSDGVMVRPADRWAVYAIWSANGRTVMRHNRDALGRIAWPQARWLIGRTWVFLRWIAGVTWRAWRRKP